MPMAAARRCAAWPRCKGDGTVRGRARRCAACSAPTVRIDGARLTPAQRGYDAAWRKLEARWLVAHPLCVACETAGRTTAAVMVDHIVSIADAPERRLDETNLQSLCASHHAKKTQGETGGAWAAASRWVR